MTTTADCVNFNPVADLYERLGEPMSRPFCAPALDHARVGAGDRIIDVAAGTGALAVAAAERGARVLATDIAPAMVGRSAERLRGYEGCAARVMSADALDVADGTFDAAFSLFGILAFGTWPKGLAELVRVTRPGGWIAATIWDEARDAAPPLVLKRVFEDCFPDRPLWPPNFFPAWSLASLEAAMFEAGCSQAQAIVCDGKWRPIASSGKPLVPAELLTEGDLLFRNYPGYAALDDTGRDRLRVPLAEAFGTGAGPEQAICMPSQARLVVGRKAV